MNRDEFLQKIERINVWQRRGERAPHKPLLLLLALGRVLGKRERLAAYMQIESRLTDLLKNFGPPRKAWHPEFPFGRLPADELWEIPERETLSRTASGDLRVRDLRERGVQGGFPEPLYDLLRNRPELGREAAQRLLDGHFPESLHDELRDAVGIPRTWVARDAPLPPRRDPAFRDEVLREYQRRCAVCDFDVRLGNELIGLEAAHIKWHAAGGPDEVANGLALCGLHHKAFDRGAFGLEPVEAGGYKVLVSSEVHGLSAPVRWFLDYHDKPLRSPRNRCLGPDPRFVKWHGKKVFRPPALT